jgi:trehalose 6-phosphate synthase
MDQTHQRLLVIANRLPITLQPLGNGDYDFQASAGGLATSLKGLCDQKKFKWFGWPGIEVPRKDIKKLETRLASEHHAVPIWLSNTLATHHYNGFSSTFRSSSSFTRLVLY